MKKQNWAPDWQVRIRVWVEREGHAVLGEGRAELLAAIDSEHSITKAAKAAGMSYRRAWNLIQEVNDAAGHALVEAEVGGKQGGGARLTEAGRLSLAVYNDVRRSLVESAAGALDAALHPRTADSTCVHLAAAISLQEAIGQVLSEFALRDPMVRVRAIFGASNELGDQLEAGAPGDVIISAEVRVLDRLEKSCLLSKNSRRALARNGLAIVGSPRAATINKPNDLLAARFKRVAVAEAACPLGHYAKTYLEKVRVYDQLQPKLLHVNNSRAVLSAVASGAAQAGVAFSSDASGQGAWRRLMSVPTTQATTTYELAAVGRKRSRAEVKTLCDFLTSPAAVRCYRRCGLRPL